MPGVVSVAYLIIFLLIVLNGVFAAAEFAVVSARRERLRKLSADGDRHAALALDLAQAPTRFLSTVQVGITMIAILAGAVGEREIAQPVEERLRMVNGLANYAEPISLGAVVLVIGFLSVVLGELVPKQIALHRPESVASALAGLMKFLEKAGSPVVGILEAATRLIVRPLGLEMRTDYRVTSEEIMVLVDEGLRSGALGSIEQEILKNALSFGERPVGTLMTPRSEIDWLGTDDDCETLCRRITETSRSRYPVVSGSIDNVVGVVKAREWLASQACSGGAALADFVREALIVPESTNALHLLEQFKHMKTKLAVVVDEFGGVLGIVTLFDVLEELVGDIAQVDLPTEQEMVQREDGSWLLGGMLSTNQFRELFQVGPLPGEETGQFETIAGFVMMTLGKVPEAADHFEWEGLRFEVVDMDGRRIDKILVSRMAESPDE
jgi:putative hemolysin